jgi:UDP-N-acetylmuramate dehydrogenase
MRLGGVAKHASEVHSKEELLESIKWAETQAISPIIMLGSGSNVIWKDGDFDGLLVINKILGHKSTGDGEGNTIIQVGSGEIWDSVVARAVEADLHGIESLSLIPGTAGAAPVQNIGAYGQEIAQTLVEVEAYDSQLKKFVVIANKDCGFSYRSSRFKTSDKRRFFITSVTLKLNRSNPEPPFYDSLQQHLDENSIQSYTPKTIREAVINIRQSKLPDPAKIANNGSFYALPIIGLDQFEALKSDYPEIIYWQMPNNKIKLAAGWLIDQAGFKDYHDQETGMATWHAQRLVLVNEHAKSTADLMAFSEKIKSAIQTKFGITLELEPEVLP